PPNGPHDCCPNQWACNEPSNPLPRVYPNSSQSPANGVLRAFADPLQFASQVPCALPPVVHALCQAFANDVIERRRRQRFGNSDRGWFLFQDGRGNAQLSLALERFLPGERFIENCAQRENVAPAIEFLAFHLLRRHVLERAD